MLEQDAIEVVRNYDLLMQPEDAVAFVIDYVKANRHLLNCACDTMGRDEMRRFFHTDFFGLISGAVCRTEKQLGLDTGENFRYFLSEFYTEALAGILITIFRDHVAYSQEELQANVLLILRQAIPGALREKAAGQGVQSLPPEDRSPEEEKISIGFLTNE